MSTYELSHDDLWYVQEVQKELKKLYSVSDADADRLVQESNLLRLLAIDPLPVHHDAPVFWARTIARQRKLQTTKPL